MKYLLISLMFLIGCSDTKPAKSYHYELIINSWPYKCKTETCYNYGCHLTECVGRSEVYEMDVPVDEIRQATNYVRVED